MAPVVHGLEAKYHTDMNFVYIDIEDPASDSFKRELGYLYQPNIFLVDGEGNILNTWLGIVPSSTLENAILSAIGS